MMRKAEVRLRKKIARLSSRLEEATKRDDLAREWEVDAGRGVSLACLKLSDAREEEIRALKEISVSTKEFNKASDELHEAQLELDEILVS